MSLAFSHFFPLLDQLKNSAFSDLLAKPVINAKCVMEKVTEKSLKGPHTTTKQQNNHGFRNPGSAPGRQQSLEPRFLITCTMLWWGLIEHT